jgi:hypothetical protein
MRRRVVTAIIIALISAIIGAGISMQLNQGSNMLGITLATGIVGFLFGLAFNVRVS